MGEAHNSNSKKIHAFASLKSPFDSLYWYNSPDQKNKHVYGNRNSNSKIFTRPPPHLSDLFWILYIGTTLPDLKTQAGVWEQLAIQIPQKHKPPLLSDLF